MKVPNNYSSYFSKGDHLLVLGGYNGTSPISNVESITFDSNDDDCVPAYQVDALYHHATITSSKGVVSCGGWDRNGRTTKCSIQSEGVSSSFPSMVNKRFLFGMVNVNGIIYSIGGKDSETTMETIELSHGTEWKEEEMPFGIGSPCVVNLGAKIYVIGGYSGDDIGGEVCKIILFVTSKRILKY